MSSKRNFRWERLALIVMAALLLITSLAPARVHAGGGPPLLYVVSGVADDGAQGVNGKVSTAITCTNPANISMNLVIVYYNSNSAAAYSTGALVVASGTTLTFSTQPSEVFFDDYTANSNAIIQGFARIYASSPALICTALLLDPGHNPPVYMAKLPLHTPNGIPVNVLRRTYLPAISR